jgi:hypothetical protein
MRSLFSKRTIRVAAFAVALPAIVATSASRTFGYHANTCVEATALGLLPPPPNENKVTLCHFTGSDGNPFVINQPSISAALTHTGHHDDCARYFDGTIVCGL